MTIVAGFKTNEGVLICGDMQQTISGYIKTYDGKVDLILCKESETVLAIAGAGDSDYIKTAKQMVSDEFHKFKTAQEIKYGLRQTLLTFYDDHMDRLVNIPSKERPSVELLIGVSGKSVSPHLYYYSGTAFYEVRRYKAIGDGILLANDMLGRYQDFFTLDGAAAIAIYILAKTKERVDGCGGDTHMVALRKGWNFSFGDFKEIKNLERKFLAAEKKEDKKFSAMMGKHPLHLTWQSEYMMRKSSRKGAAANE